MIDYMVDTLLYKKSRNGDSLPAVMVKSNIIHSNPAALD